MSDDHPDQAAPGVTRGERPSVKRGWIAAILVAGTALAIVLYKETGNRPSSGSLAGASPEATVSRGPSRAATGSVLLFADPEEAGSDCGCGQIIRLVRDAGARGVAVREAAPGSDVALEHEYRVTVAPTLLFLDSSGEVIARHEGEAPETIEAIRSGLHRLEDARL
jgi:hypothetical protein